MSEDKNVKNDSSTTPHSSPNEKKSVGDIAREAMNLDGTWGRKIMTHDELIEHYKKMFQGKPILSDALIKLAEAKKQIGQISYSETGHKRISPLQIFKDYPDVVKAVALSKVALKRARESSDVNEHKRFAKLATDSIYLAMQNKMLPAYMSNYLQALQESLQPLLQCNNASMTIKQNSKYAQEIEKLYPDLQEDVKGIYKTIRDFLRKFERIALKNEKASATNACWSKWLAIIAICISLWAICTDKSDELIDVVKKSHPWSEQQISADDAKNVSVAFHAITEALQKNVQLEKDNIQLRQETDRLQADLKKAQADLAELQNKYNTDKVAWTLENHKLHAEIAALKKQIEDLKAELIKRPVPQSVSRQEAKNE